MDKEGGVVLYTNVIQQPLQFVTNFHGRMQMCPGIFQPYIEKAYELRVTVVGDKIFAARIESQTSEKTRVDWRRYDFTNVVHSSYQLPKETENQCVAVLQSFNLQFGAIDMIATPTGEYYFLELNANGQWAWIEAVTELPISHAIANLLLLHAG
mgnify:CR=1 FL=1